MTREIKFREWENNKMNYNPVFYDCYSEFQINEDIKDHIIMQYTWLKDKNWIESFFWDFVKFKQKILFWFQNRIEKWPEIIWIIKHNNLWHSCIIVKDKEFCIDNVFEWEIIWNIYENPELLDTNK